MSNYFPFSSPQITQARKKTVAVTKKSTESVQKEIETSGLNASTDNDAFFPKYNQFKNKPKEAIKHLLKVKKGDCLNALYRKDIGFIDIVWGENDSENKGFGLKHIVEKHGKEIEQLGFTIEDFIPIVVQFGDFKVTDNVNKIELSGKMFKIVISKKSYFKGKKEDKIFVLSAFDLRPLWKKQKSSGLNGTYDGINFTKKPLLSSTLDENLNKNSSFKSIDIKEKKLSSRTESSFSNKLDSKDIKKEFNSPNVTKSLKPTANTDKNSLAYKMANQRKDVEYFSIPDKDLNRFLGKIEKKTKESVFISLTGGEGSMKTRMAFQFMNAFAQNYKVGHASIEEHPESVLYFDKAKQYLDIKAQGNITNPEVNNLSSLHNLIMKNDVIVIDSFTKMKEIEKNFEVDRDLRKKYNGKLFIVIFQQTTNNTMRGGSKSQFDADVVLFTEKFDNYKQNYVYASKNRYSAETGLKFNIFSKQLQGTKAEVQPKTKLSFKVK